MEAKRAMELVETLRDYDRCSDSDVDKAADALEKSISRWQSAPTDDGWYWVEGCIRPYQISTDYYTKEWIIKHDDGQCVRLNGRRVAPVTGRPE